MYKKLIFATIAFVTLAILSQSGTEAGNVSHADRFANSTADGATGTYEFDKPHSFVGFKIKHNGLIEVPGFFRDFTGTVNYDAKNVSKSTVEFTAKAASVDTGVTSRDDHLRTADFFDVEKYPEITFKSTKVEKKGDKWMLTGDFTLKGVTKSITFPFNITGFLPPETRGGARMGITAETTINRRDYGIDYGKTVPGAIVAVADEVTIVLQIEAPIKKEAAPAADTK